MVAGFGLVRRSPGLAGLLAAQTISPLGDAMATTALILHVQRTTGSATAVGLLLFAQAIPPLAAPLAGVIADRFSPGRLLGVGWLIQAVLAGLVALLLPPLGALLVVVFLLALVDTPLSAAVGRCIPAVVADDDLVAANAMRSAVAELGTVLGPPLAGLLFAVSGTRLVLGLDALTFLAVIPLALRLPTPARDTRDTNGRSRPSFFRDARDGLAFIRHTPYILAVASVLPAGPADSTWTTIRRSTTPSLIAAAASFTRAYSTANPPGFSTAASSSAPTRRRPTPSSRTKIFCFRKTPLSTPNRNWKFTPTT